MSNYQFCPSPDLSTKETNFAFWENGFSESQIFEIRRIGDSLAKEDGVVFGGAVNQNIRKSKISWLSQNSETSFIYDNLAWISRQLNGQFFNFDLYGFVEDLQYTVYTAENDCYTWHMDKGNTNSSPRKLSLVLQLSDPSEYEGGDLEFLLGDEPTKAKKDQGIVYAFPSWVLHRVTPVTAGTRKSLVVWIAGPNFR